MPGFVLSFVQLFSAREALTWLVEIYLAVTAQYSPVNFGEEVCIFLDSQVASTSTFTPGTVGDLFEISLREGAWKLVFAPIRGEARVVVTLLLMASLTPLQPVTFFSVALDRHPVAGAALVVAIHEFAPESALQVRSRWWHRHLSLAAELHRVYWN